MSKTVDDRIVSMHFDNRDFEKNVRKSIGTIKDLDSVIASAGAHDGLSRIDRISSRIDFATMQHGLTEVASKFSSIDVIGITALSRVTNAALDAGARISRALTIDPISTGFDEYELKMGSVQTIMASTGASLEEVNGYLNDLNIYSDKTIYSFSDMTESIGKFTNAGVSLDDAVLAIKGISNEAALSGANANEASRAMYNFAQAISAGSVKLIDWKSIELANMGTIAFKEELIKTAVELGTLVETENGYISTTTNMNGSVSDAFDAAHAFNESLNSQWMTTDVLIKTLGRYADETTDLGKKAYSAAQDVKTYSMMMDTLKEAAQSGWSETWETIVGDFEESKELWTNLSNFFGNIIGSAASARNNFLSEIFDSPWEKFSKKISDAGIDTKDFNNNLLELAKTENDSIGQMLSDGKTLNDLIKDGTISGNMAAETLKENYGSLSQEQLLSMGYTEEQIEKIRRLSYEANESNSSIKGLLSNLTQWGGRKKIIDSFSNMFKGIAPIFSTIKKAWTSVFHIDTSRITSLVDRFHSFSKTISVTVEKLEPLRKILTGIFSIIKTISVSTLNIGGKIFGYLYSVVSKTTGFIWRMVDALGESLISFNAWLTSGHVVSDVYNYILGIIQKIGSAASAALQYISELWGYLVDFFSSLVHPSKDISKSASSLKKAVGNGFSRALEKTAEVVDKLSDAFSRLKANIRGVYESIKNKLQPIIDRVKESFKDVSFSDIASTVMVSGIYVGIRKLAKIFSGDNLKKVSESFSEFLEIAGNSLDTFQKKLKAEKLKSIAIAVAILSGSVLMLSFVKTDHLAESLAVVSILLAEVVGVLTFLDKLNIDGNIGAAASVIFIAKAVAILAKAVASLNGLDDWDSALPIMSVMAELLIGISGVAVVITKFVKPSKLFAAAVSIAALAGAIKLITMTFNSMSDKELFVSAGAMLALGTALYFFVSKLNGAKLIGVASTLAALSVGMIAIAASAKIFSSMGIWELAKGLGSVSIMMLIMSKAVSKMGSVKISGAAGSILAIGVALSMLMVPILILGKINFWDMAQGLLGVALAIGTMSAALIAISDFSLGDPKQLLSIGASMLLMSVAISALVIPLAVLGAMPLTNIGAGILGLVGAFTALALASVVLAPISGIMLAVAGAFAVFGAAVLTLGAGVMMLVSGLSALVAMGTAGCAALVAAFGAFLAGLVVIMPALGNLISSGLIAIADAIANAAPSIGHAVTVVVLEIIDCAYEVVPPLIDLLLFAIETLLHELAEHIPDILHGVGDVIISILSFLTGQEPEYFKKGWDAIQEFLSGILSVETFDAIFSVITDMLSHIASFGEKLWNKGVELMDAIIDGFKTGNWDAVKQAGKELVEEIWNGIVGAYDWIKEKAGQFWDWVKGIFVGGDDAAELEAEMKETVENAVRTPEEIANDVRHKHRGNASIGINSFKKDMVLGMNRAIRESNREISKLSSPTIRPVIDLSGIQNGMKQISSMMSNQLYGVSYEKASHISSNFVKNSTGSTADYMRSSYENVNHGNPNNYNVTNQFYIKSDDPRGVANEVSKLMQNKIDRRKAAWGM